MPPNADAEQRPVLIAYDGSSQAKGAIVAAARELAPGRRAIVLTVREPLDHLAFAGLGGGTMLDPATVSKLQDSGQKEAAGVAEEGAQIARDAGFAAEARVEVARAPGRRSPPPRTT
jgi:hypothetical protein